MNALNSFADKQKKNKNKKTRMILRIINLVAVETLKQI